MAEGFSTLTLAKAETIRPGETDDQFVRRILGCHRCGVVGQQYVTPGPNGYTCGCNACSYRQEIRTSPKAFQ